MVAVLVLSAVDRALEHRSGHTKDYKVGGCCSERAKTGCLGIWIMHLSEATCLPMTWTNVSVC